MSGKKVVITAGPTREPIDPVRYITNRSSGKMGYALARAACAAGARVTLISGPVALSAPAGVERVDVETAQQMLNATLDAVADADIFIGAAAVADYRPRQIAEHKIKKRGEEMELSMTRAPDILATVAASTPRPFVVGFAAETQNLEANARTKLEQKGLDLIAANLVGRGVGFDCDDNALLVLWADGQQQMSPDTKIRLARQLVDLIAERLGKHGS